MLASSLIGKAISAGRIAVTLTQMRDFAEDRHRTVDDSPYGGGAGMVLRVDVLMRAWRSLKERLSGVNLRTILLSPQGPVLTAERARGFISKDGSGVTDLVFVCGHYEGVDERLIELCIDEELSIGDYVLTGGELPALVAIDAISRWVPGVVGKEESVRTDSFEYEGGLLKYPQYTRPREFEGKEVPPVLLSGDHGEIARWRLEQSRARTTKKGKIKPST